MEVLKVKLILVSMLFLLPLADYAQSGQPVLKTGTAEINGIVSIPESIRKDSVWLYLRVPQPFTGMVSTYKTLLGPGGKYHLAINMETDIGRCAINTDLNMSDLATVMVKSGQENRISFNYDNDATIKDLTVSDPQGFTEEELIGSLGKFTELITTRSDKAIEPLYDKEFSYFLDHANNVLQRKRKLLDNPPFLSDRMKEIIFKDYSLAVYANHVLDYHGEMVINYSNTNGSRQPDSSQIRKLGRKDFTYLQSLDLNNPLYLFCFSYPTFTQELLRNEVLNVPRIGETPIGDWLREVKRILGPLMGIDKGLYYDMLVGNAFAMQFELELMPLTPKQVRNIKDYYRDGDLERILLRRNREIEAQARLKEELVINATPGVAPEELMQAIISRYKGKTVVVDYWATWCAPCLEAFGESRELKKRLAGKDVVFVYITSPSSPRKLWEKFIQGIGGQQYYLTSKEWAFLQRTYDFSGIPTYMIFDGNGALQQKFTGYPGNDEMLARIEAVLKGVSR